MPKYFLYALDTFDMDSDSFLVGEYDSLEKAQRSRDLRLKRKSGLKGNTFYKYYIVDEEGNRIEG